MDGLDLSAIDQIDQDVFNGSPMSSDDGDCDMPMPSCIGVDSALQDEEQTRIEKSQSELTKAKTRSETERELELKLLKPNSIRRQILERSLQDGNNKVAVASTSKSAAKSSEGSSHVMNIVEKAGMSGIDKERINEIIHEASRGSLFYRRQAQRQAEIHKSIEKMLNKVKAATPSQVGSARITCDKLVSNLEKQRLFNKVIVHFDLDMFFAAVEIRDNPELADKPIAVGGESMVSTSNYIARRFGVRAAMPGFIAKKLCPELRLIKPNGIKYRQASSEVFSILEEYDPELTSMSLDEAYLDLTEYIKGTLERDGHEITEYYDGTLPKIWWTRANEVVGEIREAIYAKTKLTCSAGIACNTLLAKISTDINKPNGQFMVEGYPKEVTGFIHKTPVEKVSGIGKVSAQFLHALDIKTCGDLYEKRHFLPLVFYEINVKFYLRVALGDGSTCIKSDEQRKSKSVERTFSAIKDTVVLLEKLEGICEELCTRYLKPYRIRGRTVTLKLKRNTFTTTTKSYSMLVPTNDKLVIYSAAKNLLLSEVANEPAEISYRLLGVKLSNLADDGVATNQLTIDAMLRNQEINKTTKTNTTVYQIDGGRESGDEVTAVEHAAESQLVTQEDPIRVNQEISQGSDRTSEASHDEAGCSGPKRKAADITAFLSKQSRKETNNNDNDASPSSNETIFFSQEDNCDPPSSTSPNGPNELSQAEQMQNQPYDEDFQCPYCFKPFSVFIDLEQHVDRCYLKTPIDVNKTFFSQRPKTQSNTSDASSQAVGVKSRKLASTQLAQPTKLASKTKKLKTKTIDSFLSSSPNLTGSSQTETRATTPKISFYQKFIESNSQSLSQSPKIEPFQCPFCVHGFLSFDLLEEHVISCSKRGN